MLIRRLRYWLGNRKRAAALREEMELHLAEKAAELREAGLDEAAARAEAMRRFGNVVRATEDAREVWLARWVEDFSKDLRYGVRLLGRTPVFALTAALSLSIGVAASTSVFTVANALLFRPPEAVADPDRLADIYRTQPGNFGVHEISYPDYLDIRRRATTLNGVYLFEPTPNLASFAVPGSSADSAFRTIVSPNYFEVLGITTAAGRLFGEADAASGVDPVVVLSHDFWNRRFQRDPSVVGRTVEISGEPFVVAGVAAEGFHGTLILAPDLWTPVGATPGDEFRLSRRDAPWGLMGARIRPDVSRSEAAAEVELIGLALTADYPESNRGAGLRLARVSPIPGSLVLPVAGIFTLLIGFVSLVLVIACANVAGVLLARAASRRREIAVRLAIGAGRFRLVRQLLTEVVVLFVLGGAGGLLLSRILTGLIVTFVPQSEVPFILPTSLDLRIVGFAAAASLLAAACSGLAPALQASRPDVVAALKDETQGLAGRSRLRQAFVVSQVACSIILVVVAGLLAGALQPLSALDFGYDPTNVELASIDLAQAGYSGEAGAALARELVERARTLPGVAEAAMAFMPPTSAGRMVVHRLRPVGDASAPPPPPSRPVAMNAVSPGYFDVMKIPLRAGRGFQASDHDRAPRVAIISESAARNLWPDGDAVGRYLPADLGDPVGGALVIGVAGNVRPLVPNGSEELIYVPLDQHYVPRLTLAVRTSEGMRAAGEIRALLTSIDRRLPVLTLETLEEAVLNATASRRIAASLTGMLGGIGLLLASIGVYGVTAYVVACRTREFGIRIALGASRAAVMGMVLRQGLRLVAAGTAIGLALSVAASRLLGSAIFNLPPLDLSTFVGSAVLFAIMGLAACYVPARRALRINPINALRND